MNSHIRIESPTITGHNGQVFYVDGEGNETDISGVVNAVDFHMDVQGVNTAELHVVKVRLDGISDQFEFIEAQLQESKQFPIEYGTKGLRRWS